MRYEWLGLGNVCRDLSIMAIKKTTLCGESDWYKYINPCLYGSYYGREKKKGSKASKLVLWKRDGEKEKEEKKKKFMC